MNMFDIFFIDIYCSFTNRNQSDLIVFPPRWTDKFYLQDVVLDLWITFVISTFRYCIFFTYLYTHFLQNAANCPATLSMEQNY